MKRSSLDEPESNQSWPGHGVGERQEGHEGGTKHADQVANSHHEESGVGPSGSDDTGDQEGDDLEGSTGTVEQSGIEGGKAETSDDGARKVGQDTVGDRGSKHGNGEQPAVYSQHTLCSRRYDSPLGVS